MKDNKTNTAETTKNQKLDMPGKYSFEEKEAFLVAEAAEEYVLLKYREKEGELEPGLVSEALAEYARVKIPGRYTLEDYLALPEDRRAELIDGVLYDMATPNYIHQDFALRIWRSFADYIDKKHGRCRAFAAPLSVQLDRDDKTVLEPDVLIVCDPSKFQNGRIYGAPDLVVEVLSPSTANRDLHLKLAKYKIAGVREYWIVVPKRKHVFVYEFEKSDSAEIYGIESVVPVGIYNGECKVDFARIYEQMRPLYDTMKVAH
ncbi:MAG: Uma2 family endonuclease [Lachnospiraceae bacterium]|nr:Uma2 family endonuclease [Lachnospiraceae bacterium]